MSSKVACLYIRVSTEDQTELSPDAQKIRKRVAVLVIFAVVDFACRNSVAEHFYHVSDGHFHVFNLLCLGVVVVPVFVMVAVSALVVHPRKRTTVNFTLTLVGTSVALKKPCSGDKLGGAVL